MVLKGRLGGGGGREVRALVGGVGGGGREGGGGLPYARTQGGARLRKKGGRGGIEWAAGEGKARQPSTSVGTGHGRRVGVGCEEGGGGRWLGMVAGQISGRIASHGHLKPGLAERSWPLPSYKKGHEVRAPSDRCCHKKNSTTNITSITPLARSAQPRVSSKIQALTFACLSSCQTP